MPRSFKKHRFFVALGFIALGALVLASACKSSSGDSDDTSTDSTDTTTTTTTSRTIKTIAGTGTAAYSGDGGAATSATLDNPGGVAVDTSGNIYIADAGNDAIRKVEASTGYISTVAGTGSFGYSGDGGAAASATLDNPGGVAIDSSGNIYIVELNSCIIRKVTASTGYISTVAGVCIPGYDSSGYSGDGGAATSAKLATPHGVAVDSSGNIYIADTGNNAIRKVTASTGYISTVAGTGTQGYSGDGGLATTATLYYPRGVAVDSSGDLYIADSGNNVIRKVTAATGYISTIAGTGTAGYSGDGGAATSAKLNYPAGVALDSSGTIYIVDQYNSVIRKVTASTGYISTVAGTGTAGYSGDGGAATSATLYYPRGMAVDSSGDIYVADGGNNVVREVLK